MSYTFTEHTANGTQVTFPFTFAGRDKGYIKAADIYVEHYISSVWTQITTGWALSGTNQITYTVAPTTGLRIRIRRVVEKDEPYAEFSRNVALDMNSLNNSFIHLLEVSQEILDGFYPTGYFIKQDVDWGGSRIINLGPGQDPGDAVNKGQLDAVDQKHTTWNSEQDVKIDALIAGAGTGLTRSQFPPISVVAGTTTVDLGQPTAKFSEIELDGLFQPASTYVFALGVITFSEPLPACTVSGFVTF